MCEGRNIRALLVRREISGKKMCRCALVLVTVVAVAFITAMQINTAIAQISQLGDDLDLVTLKTVDAGTFIGQRVSSELPDQDPNELPRSYFSFRGIPYAQPPIGPLRWEPPVPAEVRRQARLVTQWKPMCSQWDPKRRKVVGNADCLYLNVFTPYVPSNIRPPNGEHENTTSWTVEYRNFLPVMVYIHGGEFIAGSSHAYGPLRFMKKDVVLVTFDYRLGLLGFLTNGEESLQGNYGLLDQIEALRWIQKNIYRFGGNPLRVSVFGNVEYLLLAQGTKGLFHNAIITPSSTSNLFSPALHQESGESEGKEDAFRQRDSKALFHLVAKEGGCALSSDDQSLECLRQLEVESLIRIQNRLSKFFSYPHHAGLGPVADTWSRFPLIPANPENLISKEKFLSVPLLVGASAYEGFNPFFEFYFKLGPDREEKLGNREYIMESLETTLKIILGFDHSQEDSEFHRIFKSVWDFYFGSMDDDWENEEPQRILWKVFRIFGDLTVNSGQRKLAIILSSTSNAPVFNYIFNSSADQFMIYLQRRINNSLGYPSSNVTISQGRSLHSVESPPWKEFHYLFEPLDQDFSTFPENGKPMNNVNDALIPSEEVPQTSRRFSKEDESLSDFLIKLWVSFANYGSPKQGLSKSGNRSEGKWARAADGNLNYFVLGHKSYPLRGDFRKAESTFWTSILPQIRDLAKKIGELESFPLIFWIFVGLTAALILISIILIIFICCGCRNRRDSYDYGEDNVVFLKRIPA